MFDLREIDTEVLIQEVPTLSIIERLGHDWDDLGYSINLEVQGFGLLCGVPSDEPPAVGFLLPPKDYWSSVKKEVFTLLCTKDPKYSDIRNRLSKPPKITTVYILSTLSVWLSSHLGAQLEMITPLVATVLYGIAKLGKEAWCDAQRQSRKKASSRRRG